MLIVLFVALALGLVFRGRGFLAWLCVCAASLLPGIWSGEAHAAVRVATGLALAIPTVVASVPGLRRRLISARLMPLFARALPRLGETEQIALEAGTVWWDAELFSGRPRWQRLLDFRVRPLDEREQQFIDGPVAELCRCLDDWEIQQQRDLPAEVWELLRRERFFGMSIPREFGGLGLSALAQSRAIARISSRSVAAAVTAMVPNSLGPGELLLRYGTEEQKLHYLPRLARGEEIPCFALTGPEAGSDAAATQSVGIVERRSSANGEILGIRLDWNKRYITLAPVATLIGLAFRLEDPQGLLGGKVERGITCALIPRVAEGVTIGARHDPMGIPFMNGPIEGRGVFVPLSSIIGGASGIGQGWRMLMECLSAGRSISLPALAVGAAQVCTRICGAYASVRDQFDTPIGRFEGVEEPLARIAGLTWLMTATRDVTCGALDAGERPAVLGSIAKAYLTESMRQVVSDAMDIRAGSAIQRGPRNALAHLWSAVPIGITVEGANILTRSMIIFGQGAIRCHPFLYEEVRAVEELDLPRFDRALFAHANHVATCAVRSCLLALSGSRLAGPPRSRDQRRYYQHLSRLSAAFALISDAALGLLGGSLKRREKISGRLADALAYLYLASCALKRHADLARSSGERALTAWSVELCLHRVQLALLGALDGLPSRPIAGLLRWLVFPLGARFRPPSDQLGERVAREILEDRDTRIRMTGDIFVPPPHEPGLGVLEGALDRVVEAMPIEAKLRAALRAGQLERVPPERLDEEGLAAGVLSPEEYARLGAARASRDEAIAVDAFDARAFLALR